jgi:hypothetical protein
MRFLAYLNRGYTPGQSVALLISALAVLVGTQLVAIGVGVSQPVAAITSLALSLGAYLGAAALVDRRTRT